MSDHPAGPEDTGNIVPLPPDTGPPATRPRPSAPGRLHGLAIAGMAVSALTGIVMVFALVTIRWPGSTRGYVVGVLLASVLIFVTSASAAVLTAARDTYARRGSGDGET